jgi:hypothetical protein
MRERRQVLNKPQYIVFRHELTGNPVSDRGRGVDKADTFVTGLQAFRHEVHDDIVQEISAAIIEGANVIAWLEAKTRTVRSQRQGHLTSVTAECTARQAAGAGRRIAGQGHWPGFSTGATGCPRRDRGCHDDFRTVPRRRGLSVVLAGACAPCVRTGLAVRWQARAGGPALASRPVQGQGPPGRVAQSRGAIRRAAPLVRPSARSSRARAAALTRLGAAGCRGQHRMTPRASLSWRASSSARVWLATSRPP